MATALTEEERALLEQTLDAFATAADVQDYRAALALFERAAPIVRERPAGCRRVRSDFNQRRAPGQMELGA